MWFAWKIVLLQYRKQLTIRAGKNVTCCDLLEKSYFCSITNSSQAGCVAYMSVVICLKNRTFAVSQTAGWHRACTANCCDLLEKSYFCSITNSTLLEDLSVRTVVICLKNRTFAVSQTAQMCWMNQRFGLWFAWKIVLLQYHKQQSLCRQKTSYCCDLLEKSYFCSITNS